MVKNNSQINEKTPVSCIFVGQNKILLKIKITRRTVWIDAEISENLTTCIVYLA